jgi:RHS repeat-associated protein
VTRTGISRSQDLVFVGADGNTLIAPSKGTSLMPGIPVATLPAIPDPTSIRLADIRGEARAVLTNLSSDGTLQLFYPDRTTSVALNGVLQTVTNLYGGKTEIRFQSSSETSNSALPTAFPVVAELVVDDGIAHSSTARPNSTLFTYSGGAWNGTYRQFRGFSSVSSLEHGDGSVQDRVDKKWYHQGSSPTPGPDDPNDPAGIFAGQPWKEEIGDSDGVSINRVATGYAIPSALSTIVLPNRKDYWNCKPINICAQWSWTAEYDSYGNQTKSTDLSDAAVQLKVIQRTFSADETSWILRALVRQTVGRTDNSPIEADRRYSFGPVVIEGCPQALTAIGRPSSIEDYDSANSGVRRTLVGYDRFGNEICRADPKGHQTKTTYDTTATFSVSTENAKHQVTKRQYYGVDGNPAIGGLYGQIKESIDRNNNGTFRYFDEYGRPRRVSLPNCASDNTACTLVSYAYANIGMPGAEFVRTESPDGNWSEAYLDGLGRTVRTRTAAAEDQIIDVEVEFGARGLQTRKSSPFFEQEARATWVYSHFDAFNREIERRNPDKTAVRWCYGPLSKMKLDEFGNRVETDRDQFNRIIRMRTFTNAWADCGGGTTASSAHVDYQYDSLGHLVKIADSRGVTFESHYNEFGDLKETVGSDSGRVINEYDLAGKLVDSSDDSHHRLHYEYDALNRPTLVESIVGQTATRYKLTWDGGLNGVGKLTNENGPTAQSSYEYDEAGQMVQQTTRIDGRSHTTRFRFDQLGRVSLVDYLDGQNLQYQYDKSALTAIFLKDEKIASFGGFTPFGAATETRLGDLERTDTFSGVGNSVCHQPINEPCTTTLQKLSPPMTLLEHWHYGFDDRRQLTAVDASESLNHQRFEYDLNGRLIIAKERDEASSFKYDASDNLTNNGPLGPAYYPAGKNRPSKIGSYSLSYDEAGRLIRGLGGTFSYDARGLLTDLKGPATQLHFDYSASGRRLKKYNRFGSTSIRLNKWLSCVNGDCRKWIWRGGTRLGWVSAGGTERWLVKNISGTDKISVDKNGNLLRRVILTPYRGRLWDSANRAGSNILSGVRIYGSRAYLPALGHFITPELAVKDPYRPAGYNRYAYALNDPIGYADPDGRYSWTQLGNDVKAYGPYVLDGVIISTVAFATAPAEMAVFAAALASLDLEGRGLFVLTGQEMDGWNFASGAALNPSGMGALYLGAIIDPDHVKTWVTAGTVADAGLGAGTALFDAGSSAVQKAVGVATSAASAGLAIADLFPNAGFKGPWDTALGIIASVRPKHPASEMLINQHSTNRLH